jgi:hypothetical protein
LNHQPVITAKIFRKLKVHRISSEFILTL